MTVNSVKFVTGIISFAQTCGTGMVLTSIDSSPIFSSLICFGICKLLISTTLAVTS